jgi:Spy/CpxP family protein refolding chaperone
MKTLALSLLLAATLPVAAQRGPGGPPPGGPNGFGPGGPGGPASAGMQSPDDVLKDVLGLTDAQLTQLHTLLDSRRSAADALRTQIDAAQKAVHDAVEATTPDAATIGNAVIALQNLQKQVQSGNDYFKTSFAAILTADQKAKYDAIVSLLSSLKGAQALQALGVA